MTTAQYYPTTLGYLGPAPYFSICNVENVEGRIIGQKPPSKCYTLKNTIYLAISLCIIMFCFIYIVVCFNGLLLLLNSIPLYRYTTFYLLISPIDGHLVCFQFSDNFIIQFYFVSSLAITFFF